MMTRKVLVFVSVITLVFGLMEACGMSKLSREVAKWKSA